MFLLLPYLNAWACEQQTACRVTLNFESNVGWSFKLASAIDAARDQIVVDWALDVRARLICREDSTCDEKTTHYNNTVIIACTHIHFMIPAPLSKPNKKLNKRETTRRSERFLTIGSARCTGVSVQDSPLACAIREAASKRASAGTCAWPAGCESALCLAVDDEFVAQKVIDAATVWQAARSTIALIVLRAWPIEDRSVLARFLDDPQEWRLAQALSIQAA